MVNVRDVISSIIFYGLIIVILTVIVRVGRTYGWAKVDEEFKEMEPGIGRGEYMWINKRACKVEDIRHNDMIVYRRPPWKRVNWTTEVARVIGLPGDLVRLRFTQIFRAERQKDGQLAEEAPVTEYYVAPYQRPQDFGQFMVPRNTVFVMFDQRRGRQELRNLIVPERSILGKVIH